MSDCKGDGGCGNRHDKKDKAGVDFPACSKCKESLADWTEGEFLPINLPECPVCAREDISKTRNAAEPPEMFIVQVGVSYPYDGRLTIVLGCPKGHQAVQKFEVNGLLSSISWMIKDHEGNIKWN